MIYCSWLKDEGVGSGIEATVQARPRAPSRCFKKRISHFPVMGIDFVRCYLTWASSGVRGFGYRASAPASAMQSRFPPSWFMVYSI